MSNDRRPLTGRFFNFDQTFIVGLAAFEDLVAAIDERGLNRLLLLSSPGTSRGSGFELLSSLLGDRVVARSTDIRAHAPTPDTERLATEYQASDLDAIVAFGGGSVSDTAKGISILLAEGGPLEDKCSIFVPPDDLRPVLLHEPKIPVISVPTTLSGAEVTPGGGATTPAGIKRVFWDGKVASRIVCLDPRSIVDTPAEVLTSTGANALAHCAEGLYSRTRTPFSDGVAYEATRSLARGLAGFVSGDDDDRDPQILIDMLSGAAMSGVVISNARVGLHHAFCHVLGARIGLAHGDANAIMLAHAMRFNLPVTRSEQGRFAEAILAGTAGIDEVTARMAVVEGEEPPDTVERFLMAIGAPTRLRDVGVERSQLAVVAEEVMQDRGLFFNPRPVAAADEVLPVLEAAW